MRRRSSIARSRRTVASTCSQMATRYEAFIKSNGADTGPVIERPGLRPERRDGRLRQPGCDQSVQLQARTAGRVVRETGREHEVRISVWQVQWADVRGLLLVLRQASGSESASAIRLRSKDSTGCGSGASISRTTSRYNEKLTTRFRLEANSNGDFTGGDLVPYVKDAYLKWTYRGSQQLTLGIHPTLTFDWLDGFWGLRHIEKTPADLYRLDSSRDFGFTVDGPTPVDGLSYAVQFGNESGNGSETAGGQDPALRRSL